jgi:hypothetical protein
VLGNSGVYQNLFQTVPGIYNDGRALAHAIRRFFKWKKIGIISTTGLSFVYSHKMFDAHASEVGLHVLSDARFPEHSSDAVILRALSQSKASGARIYVLLMEADDAYNVLRNGIASGVFHRGIQLVGGESLADLASWERAGLGTGDGDGPILDLLSGLLAVKWQPTVFPSPHVTSFVNRWRSRPSTTGQLGGGGHIVCDETMDSFDTFYAYQYRRDPYNSSSEIVCNGVEFSSFAEDGSDLTDVFNVYDSVLAVALGLHHLIHIQGVVDPSPAQLSDTLLHSVSFDGLSGNVSFSSRYAESYFDVGRRYSGIVYSVVNLHPVTLSPSHASDSSSTTSLNLDFREVTTWHSELGFPACKGHITHYTSECYDVVFMTQDELYPSDYPPPVLRPMKSGERVVLKLLSALLLVWVVIVVFTLVAFKKRRIISLSQPPLTMASMLACVMCAVQGFTASYPVTTTTCTVILWCIHLCFILFVAALLVRIYRVKLITSSLRKTNFSAWLGMAIVGAIASVCSVPMAVLSAGNLEVYHVDIVKDQFTHEYEDICKPTSYAASAVLYSCEGVLLLIVYCLCWKVWNVTSALLNVRRCIKGTIGSIDYT